MTSPPPDTSFNPAENNGTHVADADRDQAEDGPASFKFHDNITGSGNSAEIIVDDENWLTISKDFAFAGRAALLALAQPPRDHAIKSPHHLAVIMLSDDHSVQGLNKTYRGKDQPTNILSFPASPAPNDQPHDGPDDDFETGQSGGSPDEPDGDNEPPHIGDAILAYDTVIAEAKRDGIPLENHISHLIIHGVLHLLGYDHEAKTEAEAMEALEVQLLQQLNIADPYRTHR